MADIDPARDIRSYFQGLLHEAFESRQVRASHATEAYVLNLLAETAQPERADVIERPLACLLDRAQSATGIERVRRFRELGDTALIVYGFFSGLIHRRGVNEAYVRAMGGTGYTTASSLSRVGGTSAGAFRCEVYGELAERFEEIGSVVAEVRDSTACAEGDVLAVYERWVKTGSPALARRLSRLGLYPSSVSGREQA